MMKKYKIIIDRKEYFVNTQFVTGKQIKMLAGITEEMENLAKHTYRQDKEMGWFAYKVIKRPIPDEQIFDNDEIDLIEEKESEFFTACNGTCHA